MDKSFNFTGARILLKLENENMMLADTKVLRHDLVQNWIWVDADSFDIPENTRLSALVISPGGFHEILCMTRKKESNGSGLLLSVFKQLNEEEKRHDNRYSLSAEGSLIVQAGAENVINRQISIDIIDISSNGLGFLLNEAIVLEKGNIVDVFFVAKGWSMRATGKVSYTFGPRVGISLLNIEKNQIISDNNRLSREIQSKIDKAFEQVFITSHYIDIRRDTYTEISCMSHVRHIIGTEKSVHKIFGAIIDRAVSEENKVAIAEFFNLDTLPKRLTNKKLISMEFIGNFLGACRLTFVPVDYDEAGNLHGVLLVAQQIDSELLRLRSLEIPFLESVIHEEEHVEEPVADNEEPKHDLG